MTPPNLLFAIIAASRYCQYPRKAHWEAVKGTLSYLTGTKDYGLRYGGTNQENGCWDIHIQILPDEL